jgi:hypothetical protein
MSGNDLNLFDGDDDDIGSSPRSSPVAAPKPVPSMPPPAPRKATPSDSKRVDPDSDSDDDVAPLPKFVAPPAAAAPLAPIGDEHKGAAAPYSTSSPSSSSTALIKTNQPWSFVAEPFVRFAPTLVGKSKREQDAFMKELLAKAVVPIERLEKSTEAQRQREDVSYMNARRMQERKVRPYLWHEWMSGRTFECDDKYSRDLRTEENKAQQKKLKLAAKSIQGKEVKMGNDNPPPMKPIGQRSFPPGGKKIYQNLYDTMKGASSNFSVVAPMMICSKAWLGYGDWAERNDRVFYGNVPPPTALVEAKTECTWNADEDTYRHAEGGEAAYRHVHVFKQTLYGIEDAMFTRAVFNGVDKNAVATRDSMQSNQLEKATEKRDGDIKQAQQLFAKGRSSQAQLQEDISTAELEFEKTMKQKISDEEVVEAFRRMHGRPVVAQTDPNPGLGLKARDIIRSSARLFRYANDQEMQYATVVGGLPGPSKEIEKWAAKNPSRIFDPPEFITMARPKPGDPKVRNWLDCHIPDYYWVQPVFMGKVTSAGAPHETFRLDLAHRVLIVLKPVKWLVVIPTQISEAAPELEYEMPEDAEDPGNPWTYKTRKMLALKQEAHELDELTNEQLGELERLGREAKAKSLKGSEESRLLAVTFVPKKSDVDAKAAAVAADTEVKPVSSPSTGGTKRRAIEDIDEASAKRNGSTKNGTAVVF